MNLAKNSQTRPEPRRLHSLAPASLTISREVDWKVVIPLLSPLTTLPDQIQCTTSSNNLVIDESRSTTGEAEKQKSTATVFKKWQHPASPFCYKPTTFVPFV
ncbi:hypothetical protein LIER_27178 [Lithospermum erythrorhizon]|uniref:Uncharacterized protein n=1 Tax=Lithospermum erythrorhizon TaxID=34254 RepID=A0AAV3RF23_LITER